MTDPAPPRIAAVVFDLLTALIDSWRLWNDVAGSAESGLRWRRRYLELTYRAGAYRPYETIVAEAAQDTGLPASLAASLAARWGELAPWPEAPSVLAALGARVPLAVATNCSDGLGARAAAATGGRFAAVVTAETAGAYKPCPAPYRMVLDRLGTDPAATLFVAGSPADIPGASGVGMPVYWHDRLGLAPIGETPPRHREPSLEPLLALV